jgi:hypothetical protein
LGLRPIIGLETPREKEGVGTGAVETPGEVDIHWLEVRRLEVHWRLCKVLLGNKCGARRIFSSIFCNGRAT